MASHPSKNAGTALLLSVSDNTAHLTMNGPPRNEMNVSFFKLFHTLTFEKLKHLRVDGLVIEGAGRHFSSGANLPEIESMCASDASEGFALLRTNIETFLALSNLPFPVVAVIRGACLGAGMELALACHHRVAEKNAVFSLPEVSYDMMPGCGGTVRLPKLIDADRALELILSGRTMSAEEAEGLGLVDRCVDRGEGTKIALEIIENAGNQRS